MELSQANGEGAASLFSLSIEAQAKRLAMKVIRLFFLNRILIKSTASVKVDAGLKTFGKTNVADGARHIYNPDSLWLIVHLINIKVPCTQRV